MGVRLGHMECIASEGNITFLYTLGEGACPRSFGVNVARLAGLPEDVLRKAKIVSEQFEREMNGEVSQHSITPRSACATMGTLSQLVQGADSIDVDAVKALFAQVKALFAQPGMGGDGTSARRNVE